MCYHTYVPLIILRLHHLGAPLASANPYTALAPAFFKALAHSVSVTPVVKISSTSRMDRPFTSSGWATANAPRKFRRLSAGDSRHCGCVSRQRVSVSTQMPRPLLHGLNSSSVWLKPRCAILVADSGTGRIYSTAGILAQFIRF